MLNIGNATACMMLLLHAADCRRHLLWPDYSWRLGRRRMHVRLMGPGDKHGLQSSWWALRHCT